MDETDRKILVELDERVRASNSRIAKAVRVSKDVVNYRLNRLANEGILTGYYALLAVGRLGRSFYKLLLKFQSLGPKEEKELSDWLSTHPNTAWVGSCDGTWNMIVTISVQRFEQLINLINHINTKYGKFVTRRELLPVTCIRIFNEKYLYPNGAFAYEYTADLLREAEKIDKKDEIIIKEISKNPRINLTVIAEKLGLTPEAIAKRLKTLVKNELIVCYKPRISFTKLGYEYFHVFLSAKTPEIAKEIINYYRQHPGCISIVEESGYYDMHLEFVIKTTHEFREILKDMRNRFGNKIHEYEPLQIYTEYKFNVMPS